MAVGPRAMVAKWSGGWAVKSCGKPRACICGEVAGVRFPVESGEPKIPEAGSWPAAGWPFGGLATVPAWASRRACWAARLFLRSKDMGCPGRTCASAHLWPNCERSSHVRIPSVRPDEGGEGVADLAGSLGEPLADGLCGSGHGEVVREGAGVAGGAGVGCSAASGAIAARKMAVSVRPDFDGARGGRAGVPRKNLQGTCERSLAAGERAMRSVSAMSAKATLSAVTRRAASPVAGQ